jgi:serine/threonine protein phosphatase PrpC
MRIIDAGGQIDGSYVMDSKGHGLQCTRSLGDHEFKDIGIIPDPNLANARLCEDDLWIIAGCDGLWDVMRPDEAATIARKMTTARAVAEALQHEAVAIRETPDNLTVLVVKAGLP